MGLILLFLAIFIVGVLLAKYASYDFENLATTLWISGISMVASLGLVVLIQQLAEVPEEKMKYQLDKQQIEYYKTNDNITGEERAKVLEIIMNNNKTITMNKKWANNFWTSAFFSKEIGNYPLFSMEDIPLGRNTQ